jgi:uncharacterized protein (TIGR02646 family)
MRRVYRLNLPAPTSAYLMNQQAQVNNPGSDLNAIWKASRQAANFRPVLEALYAMSGLRKRCMYCLDSEGSDIEHFRPKSEFPSYSFNWTNFLLCCTQCGRLKGRQFPTNALNVPLLIDPSIDDPWQHLDFDSATGNIDARYDLTTNAYDPKGEETVNALQLNKREHLSKGYKITLKRLENLIQNSITENNFMEKLIEVDDHGLLGWCFSSKGRQSAPFDLLTEEHYQEWQSHQIAHMQQ